MKPLLLALTLLAPQGLPSFDTPPPRARQFITYVAEQQTIPTGKRTTIELHFRVEPGYHVNSHTPKSEFLIPTQIELQPSPGLKPDPPEYPAGQEYAFAFAPEEKLSVYAGSFTVRLPLRAVTPGAQVLHGTLHYQACDKAACYPPKSIPIEIPLTATK